MEYNDTVVLLYCAVEDTITIKKITDVSITECAVWRKRQLLL